MRTRAVGLFFAAACGVGAASVDCGSSDPGAVTIEPGHGRSRTGPVEASAPSAPPDAAADTAGGGGADGATDGDAAPDVATAADTGTGLFGPSPYMSKSVATSAAMFHSMKGGPSNPGAQQACLSCHGAGGKALEFLFAGSIYTDTDGGTGAADIEVRVVDAKGKGTSAHSDADGNYWAVSMATFAGPGESGARNAVAENLMKTSLASGDCNACHNGTTQPLLHLP